jgi:hypothetical protein
LKKNCEITKFQEGKKKHFFEYITKLEKKNIDVNIKSQEAKYLNKFLFYFLEKNGKIHCKERHHKEKAKGLGEKMA